jgi:hypothetical protein
MMQFSISIEKQCRPKNGCDKTRLIKTSLRHLALVFASSVLISTVNETFVNSKLFSHTVEKLLCGFSHHS